MFLGLLLGIGRSAIGHLLFNLSPVATIPGCLRKLTWPTFIILSKVANLGVDIEAVSEEQLQAKTTYISFSIIYLFTI